MLGITFKSLPKNYRKELSGVKPNTVRKVLIDDERYNFLRARVEGKALGGYITIEQAGEPMHSSFTRYITDVSYWEGLFIISWRHKE